MSVLTSLTLFQFTRPHPISNESRGRVRALFAELEIGAALMTRAVAKIPAKTLDGTTWKGKTGAARAISRIVAATPRPPDHRTDRVVLWRFLQPVAAIPTAPGAEPEAPRSGLVMMGIVSTRKACRRRLEPFGIAVTGHALGRLLDRSAFSADPVHGMFQAHNAMMCLPPIEFDQAFDLSKVILPAAGGAFLATTGRIGTGGSPIATCRTWIDTDQTHPGQAATLAMWARLLEAV